MKRKFITTQILMTFREKAPQVKKDIYTQLEETIAERKKLLQKWERMFMPIPEPPRKDIHAQLAETIAEYKRMKQQLNNRATGWEQVTRSIITEKKAA